MPDCFQCPEMSKVQLQLDGLVSPCCIIDGTFTRVEDALQIKREMNEQIRVGVRPAICGSCTRITRTSDPQPPIDMIDIFTNTFCPLECGYCQYAAGFGNLRIDPGLRAIHEASGTDRAVDLSMSNSASIEPFIRECAALLGGSLKRVSLSGGDSAYHSRFRQICRTINGVGAQVIYLTSGVALGETNQDFVVASVAEGKMFISISPDTSDASIYGSIKGVNPLVFTSQVVPFMERIFRVNNGSGYCVKMIVQKGNWDRAGAFIEFWSNLGAKRFSLCRLFCEPDHPFAVTQEQIERAVSDARIDHMKVRNAFPLELICVP